MNTDNASRAGAVARLALSSLIAMGTAALALHAAGQPVNPWFYVGVAVVGAKDAYSYLSTRWARAEAPDASVVPQEDTPASPGLTETLRAISDLNRKADAIGPPPAESADILGAPLPAPGGLPNIPGPAIDDHPDATPHDSE